MKTHLLHYLVLSISVFCFSSLFSVENDALIETAVYTFGNFEYTVMTDRIQNNALSDSQMYTFHKNVVKQHDILLNRFQLSKPAKIKIAICNNSHIFEAESGQTAQTSGFYDRATKILYLQEIQDLNKKKILKQTVSHKLLYLLLDSNRSQPTTPRLRILEEAFCEYHFNTVRHPEVSILPDDYNTFTRHLYRAINNTDIVKQEKAYALLNLWGAYLIEKLGTKTFLNIILIEREDKRALPQKHYDSFRKEYNETIAKKGGI